MPRPTETRLISIGANDPKESTLNGCRPLAPPSSTLKTLAASQVQLPGCCSCFTLQWPLIQYRAHFEAQFVNPFSCTRSQKPTTPSFELTSSISTESRIATAILNSRDGKAPGIPVCLRTSQPDCFPLWLQSSLLRFQLSLFRCCPRPAGPTH